MIANLFNGVPPPFHAALSDVTLTSSLLQVPLWHQTDEDEENCGVVVNHLSKICSVTPSYVTSMVN